MLLTEAWPASTSSAHVVGPVRTDRISLTLLRHFGTDNAEPCSSEPQHTGFGIRESDELGTQSSERMAHKLVRRLCLEGSMSEICWHYVA